MEVKDRLRAIRLFKDLSTYELAKRMGVSQPVVSRMERGKRDITVEDIAVIAKALDVPIEAFFYDEKMLEVMRRG